MKALRQKRIAVAILLSFASASACAVEPMVMSRGELSKATGAQIYQQICQGCHMADGNGAMGAGSYPALAGNPKLASAQFVAATILHGRSNMPAFVMRPDLRGFEAWVYFGLEDAQIADVVNHVRSQFGNHYTDAISTEQVRALHIEKKESP